MNQHLYLTGFRGTGKSSVGKILSQMLGVPVIDLDDQIEAAAEKTIREIFDQDGELAFRDWETECLQQVSSQPPMVIALGGGAILREQNRRCLAQTGTCIWLQANAETLVARMRTDDSTAQRRPALTSLSESQEVAKLLADRHPWYLAASDHIVDTEGKSPAQVAALILPFIQSQLPDQQK